MASLVAVILMYLGMIGLLIVTSIYTWFSWGYVFMKFYTWFLLPVFVTLPVLNFWQSMSIVIFLSVVKPKSTDVPVKKEDKKDGISYLVISILLPWISLFLGYLFRTWFF